jgi:Zn-finger nucleic acid-binding protein
MIPLCPVCDEPMLIVELHDVEVDYCGRCHGVWLDEGELELLAHAGSDDPLVQAHQRAGSETQQPSGAPARRKRRCPRCSRPIEIITVGRDPRVQLDRCNQGHGLWFDAGELRQLLRQFGPGAGPSLRLLDDLFAPSHEPDDETHA